ncbi:unnamed protein product [Schistosoma turkestanicum]|nr:unnamed protein product [Schistosoma turkestanicum]
MPLPKHTVQPVKLSQVVVPDGVDNELEFVVNSTICNVMRQIASVSRLANTMFEELTTDLSRLVERTVRIQNRLGKLHEDMQIARNGDEDLTAGVHEVEIPVFTSKKPTDSQVLNQNTIPPSMRSLYDQAEPAPALQQMDELRDDKKTSMRLYSDPSFFFDLWSQEMLQDHKHKKAAKKKRPKVKGKSAPLKSASNQGAQKTQLIIQQPGVGGHNLPAPLFEQNGSVNISTHMDRNVSIVNGKPNQQQFLNSSDFGNTLPPPPPPPSALHSLNQGDNAKDIQPVSHQKSDYHPIRHDLEDAGQFSSVTNHSYANHDPSSAHQMALPDPPTLPTQMASHILPPPVPAFLSDEELTVSGINRNPLLNDSAVNQHPSAQDGNNRICSPIQMNDDKKSQCINSVGMESPSSLLHNLPPPPPAPIFESKNFSEPCKSISQPSESNTCDDKSISSTLLPATSYVVSSPEISVPCSPPPPPPFLPTQNIGSESSNNQSNLQTKDIVTRSGVPQCPPADLLSAIRAGCQLRKVGERNLPDQSKCSRANSLSTLINKPKDVQAIYEAVRRRRECMENNSSDDDDDDKDSDNNSSGWED